MESTIEDNDFELVEVQPTTPKPKRVRKLKPLQLPTPEPLPEPVVASKPTRTPRVKQPQPYLARPPPNSSA